MEGQGSDVERGDESDTVKVTEYEVGGSDTLNSIAAKFDTVPSKLAQFNRLTSFSAVFPGMKLKIPPPEPPPPPKPAEVRLPEEPEMADPQFVRVNVRHITEGRGIVSGGLLLTPKVVMFNPSPNDPLVKDSDQDQFQLVCPVELVVNVAILRDFVRFRTQADAEDVDPDLIFQCDEMESPKTTQKLDPASLQEDEDSPLYLRLLMGKPMAKKLPRTAPIISYGEQNLESQYWFIIGPARQVLDHHHRSLSNCTR